ncbi:MAG: DUF3592 domain-containing protein [Verrucomicrobiota bacterium]
MRADFVPTIASATHIAADSPLRYYLLIVGLGLLSFGIKLMLERINFLLRSQKAYGKLVGFKEYRDGSSITQYLTEIVFEASDGTEHRITSDTASSRKSTRPIGSQIAVRYDPSNPDDAHMDSLWNLWVPSLAFLILGGAALFAFFHPQ